MIGRGFSDALNRRVHIKKNRSHPVVAHHRLCLRERVGPDLTLVGVGGISTADDARGRLEAGADLLQGYTAFIYEGPGWPRRIVKGLP